MNKKYSGYLGFKNILLNQYTERNIPADIAAGSFHYSVFYNVDFTVIEFNYPLFYNCVFSNCKFGKILKAKIESCTLINCIFSDYSNVNVIDSNFILCHINNISLNSDTFQNNSLINCSFVGTDISLNIEEVYFIDCRFKDVSFTVKERCEMLLFRDCLFSVNCKFPILEKLTKI